MFKNRLLRPVRVSRRPLRQTRTHSKERVRAKSFEPPLRGGRYPVPHIECVGVVIFFDFLFPLLESSSAGSIKIHMHA